MQDRGMTSSARVDMRLGPASQCLALGFRPSACSKVGGAMLLATDWGVARHGAATPRPRGVSGGNVARQARGGEGTQGEGGGPWLLCPRSSLRPA